jgi:hypothetical protein
MPRYIHCLLILFICPACHSAAPPAVTSVDLIREFDGAEKRPPELYRISEHRAGDTARPAIVAPAPGRLTFSLPLPRRAIFQAAVALADPAPGTVAAPVRMRIGISDHRTFEGLTEVTLTPGESGWREFRADLSAYAGRKWSLFYRPDRVTWRLVLAADAIGGIPAVVAWGAPAIVTDNNSAREYAARRRRLAF